MQAIYLRPKFCAILPFLTSMIKRNIRVTKWIGMVPAVAVCTACGREFKVSLNELRQVTAAQESLRSQFAAHTCNEEPKAEE
jgi:hypothetical protein